MCVCVRVCGNAVTSTYDGLVFSPAPAPQQHKQQTPVVRVSVVQPPMQQAAPVIKPTLRRKSEDSDPLIHKTPGWYQSMFQSFTNQVEECFPGGNDILGDYGEITRCDYVLNSQEDRKGFIS